MSIDLSAKLELPLVASGKVREIYDAGDDRLLLVASDRISTYDVIHPNGIPDKGKVLTGISSYWFEQTNTIVPNHQLSVIDDIPDTVRGRAMLTRKLQMLPVECIVRGYITGSGWKDYRATGTVSGLMLPSGLAESERLAEPLYTPSTKPQSGHDEAIDFERTVSLIGDRALAERVRDISLALYSYARDQTAERGVILADTKFEFGLDQSGELTLADEALTPDSSRYWPADRYELGHSQPSFDKQYVRDWAADTGWNKEPPAPELPAAVVDGTRARYIEAYERVTGHRFGAWLEHTAPRSQQ